MLQSPFYRRQLLKHMTASTKNEMLLASRRRYQRQGGGSFPATIFKVRVTGHNEMFEPLYRFDVEFDNGAVERFVDEARVLPREDAPESSTKGGGDRDSGGRRKQKQQAFLTPEGLSTASRLGAVTDKSGYFTVRQVASIRAQVRASERLSGAQFCVVTVPSIGGRNPKRFATDAYNYWRIGRGQRASGVLVIDTRQTGGGQRAAGTGPQAAGRSVRHG